MFKRISLILLVVLSLGTTSCSMLTNNFEEHNAKIMEFNLQQRKAYADGLAACGENAACQVGVTSSYFSNAGQMQLERPETPLAYIRELGPYARFAIDAFGPGAVGKNNGGINVVGDHNFLMDVGNRKTADRGAVLNNGITSEYSYSNAVDMLNHKYDFGTGGTGKADSTMTTSDASFVPTPVKAPVTTEGVK